MTFEEEVESRVVRRVGNCGYDKNNNWTHYKDTEGNAWWKDYDKNNSDNLTHFKDSSGDEWWEEFDDNNNPIYYKSIYGEEWWKEFDKDNNLIYYKANGVEEWREYDENNRLIIKKELKKGDFSAFEGMIDIDWRQPVITLDRR